MQGVTERELGRAVFDSAPLGIMIITVDSKLVDVNKSFTDFIGYDREELARIPWESFTDPRDLEKEKRHIAEMMAHRSWGYTIEKRFIRKDGKIVWGRLTSNFIMPTGNGVPFVMLMVEDITGRKEAEETYRALEVTLHSVAAAFPKGALVVFDPDLRYRLVEGQGWRELGMDAATLIGKTSQEIWPPAVAEAASRLMREGLEGNETSDVIEFADRSYLVRVSPLSPVGGSPRGLLVTQDITELRRMQKMVEFSEARHRSFVENAREGIWVLGPDMKTVYASARMADILGYTPDDITGKSPEDFVPEEVRSIVHYGLERVKIGPVKSQEMRITRKDGSMINCIMDAIRIPGEDGGFGGVAAFFYDVTELKLAQEMLLRANHKMSLLNSITRHDMVNKLAAMSGFIELAMEAHEGCPGEGYLVKSRIAGERLRRDIEFTKDYQEVGLKEPIWIPVRNAVAKGVAGYPDDIEMEIRLGDEEILADMMVEKVFHNLVVNTVTHAHGATKVRIESSIQEGSLVVRFSDNGPGIPQANKKRLFSATAPHGLRLAREILDITDATIAEVGVEGEGATFEIVFPAGRFRRPV